MSELVPGHDHALTMLRADHGHIKELLAHLETCDKAEQQEFLASLFLDLRIHSILEQQFVYPTVSRLIGKEGMADCAKDLYTMLSMMLQLESSQQQEMTLFSETLHELSREFEKHIRKDESLFSRLHKQGSQLSSLADLMESCRADLKAKLAPSEIGRSAELQSKKWPQSRCA